MLIYTIYMGWATPNRPHLGIQSRGHDEAGPCGHCLGTTIGEIHLHASWFLCIDVHAYIHVHILCTIYVDDDDDDDDDDNDGNDDDDDDDDDEDDDDEYYYYYYHHYYYYGGGGDGDGDGGDDDDDDGCGYIHHVFFCCLLICIDLYRYYDITRHAWSGSVWVM